MSFLPIALCGSWPPWQPNRAVGGKLDWHSLPVFPLCPCPPHPLPKHCHSPWALQGDPVLAASPQAPWHILAHHAPPPAPVGATRHLCSLYLLDLQLISLRLALFSQTGTPRQSETDSTRPKGLVVANRNFLIAPGKMAGDGWSTWHIWVCAKVGVLFYLGYRVREGSRAKSPCRDVGQAAGAMMGATARPKFLEIGRVHSPPAPLAPGHSSRNPV